MRQNVGRCPLWRQKLLLFFVQRIFAQVGVVFHQFQLGLCVAFVLGRRDVVLSVFRTDQPDNFSSFRFFSHRSTSGRQPDMSLQLWPEPGGRVNRSITWNQLGTAMPLTTQGGFLKIQVGKSRHASIFACLHYIAFG